MTKTTSVTRLCPFALDSIRAERDKIGSLARWSRKMRRLFSLLAVLLVVLLFGSESPKEYDGKVKAGNHELKWCHQIIIDFIQAAVESCPSAIGMLSPELAQAVQSEPDFLADMLFWKYGDPQFTSEEMSPEGTEAVFCGTITAKFGTGTRKATFRIRICKDRKEAKWCIRYVLIKVL